MGVPSWSLIGDAGPEWVGVYDGSIYFADLIPEHAGRGVARILEEVDDGIERGHRAFKIKVGRGFKWMEPAPASVATSRSFAPSASMSGRTSA